jgi:hypothetical protein
MPRFDVKWGGAVPIELQSALQAGVEVGVLQSCAGASADNAKISGRSSCHSRAELIAIEPFHHGESTHCPALIVTTDLQGSKNFVQQMKIAYFRGSFVMKQAQSKR